MKKCPFCGSDKVALISKKSAFFARCQNPACKALGPIRNTYARAESAWNHRAEQPHNLPSYHAAV